MILVLAILAFLTPTVAVVVGYLLTRKKVQEIHVLVNNRLTEALSEITRLGGNQDEF